jgi:hypothetical protein
MRLVIVLVTVVASSFGGPLPASAQPAQSEGAAQSLVVGVGGGGTIYSIATRLGSGSTVTAMAGYRLSPALLVEGAVRRHQCFDCDRFLIAEGGLQVGYPGRTVSPFVSGGYGTSSDPEFMGTATGFYLGFGSWLWPMAPWGVKLEVRGRQVGRDTMGDATLLIARRFGSS